MELACFESPPQARSGDARRSARPRRRVPLYIESLENRELLANVNWINPAGGDWNTASNWSTGVVPGAADNVTIAQDSNSTITLSTSSTVQNFILAGGTLAGAGNLTVNGTTSFTGGAMSGTGHTIAMNGLTITGFVSLDGRTLENRALAKLLNDSAGINPTISLRNGAAILNAATGTWDFQVDSFVNADDNTATSFTNLGTVTKTGTIGTVDMLTAFTNSGSVSVSAGTFDLKGGGTSTGGFTLAGGTTLAIDAGSFAFQPGTTFAGVLGAVGGLRIAGGTANFSTGTPITVSSLVESSGTLTGSDTITITGTTNWFGGTMSGAGTTIAGASKRHQFRDLVGGHGDLHHLRRPSVRRRQNRRDQRHDPDSLQRHLHHRFRPEHDDVHRRDRSEPRRRHRLRHRHLRFAHARHQLDPPSAPCNMQARRRGPCRRRICSPCRRPVLLPIPGRSAARRPA